MGTGGVSASETACSVYKAVGSRAWLASRGRAWHLHWGLRSTCCVMKWDGIPKKKGGLKDLTGNSFQVRCSYCCVVCLLLLCPQVEKGLGKALRRSLCLCGIKHHVQTWGRVFGRLGWLVFFVFKLPGHHLLLLVLCSREDAVHGD